MTPWLATESTAAADELAAPLDLLLTSSAVGMAERMMPNVAWSRFALNLGQTATHGGIAGSLARSRIGRPLPRAVPRLRRPRATSASPTRRGRATRCSSARCRPTWPPTSTVDQLFSDANLDWRDAERIRFVLDCRHRRVVAQQQPAAQPAGLQGAGRHGRAERGAGTAPLRSAT